MACEAFWIELMEIVPSMYSRLDPDTPDTAQSKPGSDLDINPYLKSTHTLPDLDWEAWNIDGDPISELRAWGAVKDFQEFIPDSPFPAKTLVKALLSIVELGIRVPLIQKKVYEFAQEDIEYIRTLVEVVGEESTLKKDLQSICTAVNDICKWAREHVLKNTLSAHDLGDWGSKFAVAKEMFLSRLMLGARFFSSFTSSPSTQELTAQPGFYQGEASKKKCTYSRTPQLLEYDPAQALDHFQTGRSHLLLIRITLEEIMDETGRYEDNATKQQAKRNMTAAIMRGIVECQPGVSRSRERTPPSALPVSLGRRLAHAARCGCALDVESRSEPVEERSEGEAKSRDAKIFTRDKDAQRLSAEDPRCVFQDKDLERCPERSKTSKMNNFICDHSSPRSQLLNFCTICYEWYLADVLSRFAAGMKLGPGTRSGQFAASQESTIMPAVGTRQDLKLRAQVVAAAITVYGCLSTLLGKPILGLLKSINAAYLL
ncbi:hypothetical protein B0H13DRAFT_1921052 [Mycena leptocephala]|nr:hypothetical protein B0H13DRAFT_1921052 [Mycena leptocephala]